MMSELTDDNLDDIVEKIYSKPPMEKNSICLQLEEDTADIANEGGDVEGFIFNILFLITYRGMKKLYGNDKELLMLTETEIATIKEYVRSYGYDLIIRGNNTQLDPWELLKSGEKLTSYQVHFNKIY